LRRLIVVYGAEGAIPSPGEKVAQIMPTRHNLRRKWNAGDNLMC
jgi:hypothetical protein